MISTLELFSSLFYWTWSRTQSSFCCWQQIIQTDRTSLLSVHGHVCVYVCPRNNVNQIFVISPVEAQTQRELVIHAVLFTVAPILQSPHRSAFSCSPNASGGQPSQGLVVMHSTDFPHPPVNPCLPQNSCFPEIMVVIPKYTGKGSRETYQTGGAI